MWREKLVRWFPLVFLLLLAACAPRPTMIPTAIPTPTASPVPSPRPTATVPFYLRPHPLAIPQGLAPYPMPYPPPENYFYGTPSPTPTPQTVGEIAAALENYNRVRAQAEETLDPELLWRVCVDPYLSVKMERIRQNARDGTHWETRSVAFIVEDISPWGDDWVHVKVTKVETKLFFPRGSALPDDEICQGAIYSYRDCSYQVNYTLERREGRWYVAEVEDLGSCSGWCRKGWTPTETPTPTPTATPLVPYFPPQAIHLGSWPALPADLYFLRDGRVWRWPQGGGWPEQLPVARLAETEQVTDYRLGASGRYVAYQDSSGALYALDLSTGKHVFPDEGLGWEEVEGYRLLADGRTLFYTSTAGLLYLVDLPTGKQSLLTSGEGKKPAWKYHLLGDDRYLAYGVPWGKRLYLLDISNGERVSITLSGYLRQVDVTADGRYLVYIGTPHFSSQPEDNYTGTLFAVDLRQPERQYLLGACGTREQNYSRMFCRGFHLSPDGRQVAFADERGLWLASVPGGEPQLLVQQSFAVEGGSFCGIREPLAWFPDGRGLLERVHCYEGGGLAVMDLATTVEHGLPQTWCHDGCYLEWVQGPAGIWISAIPGSPYLATVSFEGIRQPTATSLELDRGDLWPTGLQAFPDGRLGFIHQRCMPIPGMWAGGRPDPAVFLLEADGVLREIAPLPQYPCPDRGTAPHQEMYPGTVLWAAEGRAFLYLDASSAAVLLGRTDGTALWDVRALLRGAADFLWGPEVGP